MISEYMELLIKFEHLKYNKEVCKIPKLQSIIPVHNFKAWAEFKSEDLYNSKYILYIDDKLEDKPDEFIDQILFHEFTHIVDSRRFLKFDLEKFQNMMNIYSEIHASQIQMNRLIKTEKSKPYSLDQEVIHGGILTLRSFMDQTYNRLKKEFSVPNVPFNKSNLRLNLKELYYYVGYSKSLKNNNIIYNQNFSEINIFGNEFEKLYNYVLTEKVDSNILYEYDRNLTKLVKTTIETHNKSFINDIVNKIINQ